MYTSCCNGHAIYDVEDGVKMAKKKKQAINDIASPAAASISWAASAASFRGLLAVLSIIANLILALSFAIYVMTHTNVVYLTLDSDGRPSFANVQVSALPNHEVMVRDFVTKAFTGDASAMRTNIAEAKKLMTQNAAELFENKYWKSLVDAMTQDGVVQNLIVKTIETVDMSSDFYTIKVVARRMMSSQTQPYRQRDVTIDIKIQKTGKYTEANPWGMSIVGVQFVAQ